MVDGGIGEKWRFEFNAYQTYIQKSLQVSQNTRDLSLSTERSSLFEHNFSNNNSLAGRPLI